MVGMEQLVEGRRLDAGDRLFLRDQAFAGELHRDAQRRLRGALAVARLEHPELAGLDREFHVLHVTVMLLENAVDAHELAIGLGHGAFHRGLVGARRDARGFRDVLRGADARHHVLALRVDEELAVELALAGGGIAGERHAGGGGLAHVAEDHGLHVHRRAPARRNGVQLAVLDGAVVHPGAEHGADGAPELLLRLLREGLAELLLDQRLVARKDRLPVRGRHVGVEGIALAVLVLVEDLLEMVVLDVEHHVGIHGDEAAVGIVGEALVARALGERLDGDVVEAEIEHRVHHAGHGGAGAGADGNQQRIGGIAEGAAGELADVGERLLDLAFELLRIGAAVVVVIGADFRGDGEARRHRQAQIGHLGQIRPLAAEQVLHPRLALGLTVPEGIDPLRHRSIPWL